MQAVPRWQKTGKRHYFRSWYQAFFTLTKTYSLLILLICKSTWLSCGGISSCFLPFLLGIILNSCGPHFPLHSEAGFPHLLFRYILNPPNNPSHSIITPPFSTPCHQPPCQAGCRLAISCTRSVEPLSGLECWLSVCLSGWLTVRPVLLKCLIWSMFVRGALSPRLILTALTVCADSLSPSCCTASLHPLYLRSLYILCWEHCSLSCWSSFSACLYLEPLQGSGGCCGQLW